MMTLFSLSAFSQFRKYSNEFLNIGAGARGLSMGGSRVASVSDGTSGYWNPAGLTGIKDYSQINLMHAEYFAGIGKYDYAVAIPTSTERTLGFTGLRFAVDDIMNTLVFFGGEPDGSLNYNNIQSFSSCRLCFYFFHGSKT